MISLAEQASEFNTGKPPAGEAGLCLCKYESQKKHCFFTYWDGKEFKFNRNSDATNTIALAYNHDGRSSFTQDYEAWRFATFAEVSAEVGPEKAREMVHHSMLPATKLLWMPPQQEGFGPWVCEPVTHLTADKKADEAARKDLHDRDMEGLANGIWARYTARQAQKSDAPPPPLPETPQGLLHEHKADRFGRLGLWRV